MEQVDTIDLMKKQIMEDVRCGRVPDNVKSFSELHDYVDANEYGEFCDDDYEAERDENGDMTQAAVDFFNECQCAIDTWLATGVLATIRDVDLLGRDHNMSKKIKELRDECRRWAARYRIAVERNRH